MAQGATILIAEEDLDIQVALTDLLHHEGYQTAVCRGWTFDSAEEKRWDAVIFDIPLYRPKDVSLLSRLADLYPVVLLSH